MSVTARLSFRVEDIQADIEVAGFVSPDDAQKWADQENARIGREVYEVVKR